MRIRPSDASVVSPTDSSLKFSPHNAAMKAGQYAEATNSFQTMIQSHEGSGQCDRKRDDIAASSVAVHPRPSPVTLAGTGK